MTNDLEDRVKCILIAILQVEETHGPTVKRGYTEEWDSMAWVNIISALEDEFDIELSEEEYELVSSYELICELIREKTT